MNLRRFGPLFGIPFLIMFANQAVCSDSHEHGVAHLSLAVDGRQVTFILKASADAILGFEHQAQSAEEKETENKAVQVLREGLHELIQFEKSLECVFKNSKLLGLGTKSSKANHSHSKKDHSEHRDIEGEWVVNCQKAPTGSRIEIDLASKFSHLKVLHIVLNAGDKQMKVQLKKGRGSLKL